MENFEQILPVTKEDNKKLLQKYKPIIIGFTIFFAIALIVSIYLIILYNKIAVTILISSVYIFVVFIFFIILYGGFISPLLRDKVRGKKRQLIGIITDKLEKRDENWIIHDYSLPNEDMSYYIVLGGTEEIELTKEEYVKVAVNQKIKIEFLINSKSIISIENLSEKDLSLNADSIETTNSLSEKEIKYLKKKMIAKIIGLTWFFGLLGFIFYFILKLLIVAVIYKILDGVVNPKALGHSFYDATPLIILIFIILVALYKRINKIIKDIISKKKRIVKAKIDDKIKSDENYHKIRHSEIKTMINTYRNYSIFDKELWQRVANSMFNTKQKPVVSNAVVSNDKYYNYRYIVINRIYFKVTFEDFEKFKINEPVYVHFADNSNMPVFIQSIDNEDKIIDISAFYEK